VYDKPQTPLDRLLSSGHLDEKRCEELKVLRERLDPFKLSDVVNHKLERIWELAHYRYKPAEVEKKTNAELNELSSIEKEALEGLSQAFGIKIYVRTRKDGKLIALHHG